MSVFKTIYWVGLIIELVIRAPYQAISKKTAKTDRRVSLTENILLMMLTAAGFILPLIYSITNWLDFANYKLPNWMGWLGVFFLGGAVYLFGHAHRDLKSNWSPSLEIYERHSLVTNGIYGSIRHPMYASQWMMVLAQFLLLQNWLAGPVGLIVFIPFYILRVQAEEKMMLETFGNAYREYLNKTGGIIPKF